MKPVTSGLIGRRAGFTLVELAVTLLIVALLLGSVLVPLQTQVENRRIEDTQGVLEQAREALLGYAASHGHFPCPATATSNGQEPIDTDHIIGACGTASKAARLAGLPVTPADYMGFLPAALLGLAPVDAEGFALDSWGGSAANRIRYAVSYHTLPGIDVPFTTTGGMAAAGVPSVGGANNLFHVCGSGLNVNAGVDCGVAQTLATNAVVVVWSVGQNAISGGASAHEAENPNPSPGGGSADRLFVSRVRSTSGAAEFDDQLNWLPAFAVVSRLVASGQLP